MGDEGVGVHAAWALQKVAPPGVEVIDGGTGGFHLLEHFEGGAQLVLVDATLDGAAAGTVRVLRPRYASDYPRSLGAHDVGLRDLIESAALLGRLPPVHLVTVSIPEIRSMVMELSPEVLAALPRVVEEVLAIVRGHQPGSA